MQVERKNWWQVP